MGSVSVLIPCYNTGECVERAVRSAMEQTLTPTEIICIDDGSEDDTLEILRRLESEAPSLVRVLVGSNRGAPAARNWGLAEAAGTYVQFLDADDALEPDKLERQVCLATSTSPPADVVVGSYRRQSLDGSAIVKKALGGDDWTNLFLKQLGITSANLWRRAMLEEVGGWNESWDSSQEYELMFRLLQQGARLAYDGEIGATLWERKHSISSEFNTPNRVRYTCLRVEALLYLSQERLFSGDRYRAVQDITFSLIRSLYPFAPEAALAFHDQAFGTRYVPHDSSIASRPYVWALRLLGFRRAERLRQLFGRARNQG